MSQNDGEAAKGGKEKPAINFILDKMKLEFNRSARNDSKDDSKLEFNRSARSDSKDDSVNEVAEKNDVEASSQNNEEQETCNTPLSPKGESPPKLTPIIDGDINAHYESKMDVDDSSPPNLQATSPIPLKDCDGSEEMPNDSVGGSDASTFETPTSESKRGLRNKTLSDSSGELSSGRKRSARRWSKEGESVLQNAIARKEKCLSAIGNLEDTKGLLTAVTRSLRENRNTRGPSRSKSPRLTSSETTPDQENRKKKAEPEENTPVELHINPDIHDETGSENGSLSMEVPITKAMKRSLDTPPAYFAYTKTGKRKYKPFRGLKYSFSNYRNRKPKNRPSSRGDRSSETASNCSDRERKLPIENLEHDTQGSEISDSSDLFSKPLSDNCRSNSPAIADACNTQNTRRKHQLAKELNRSGAKTPSPSPADIRINPSKPESTAISIGAGTAGLCLCQSRNGIYLKSDSVTTESGPLLCQAIDSLEGRLVGCCNPVAREENGDVRLTRPGKRVPFMMICEIHEERMIRHNCCPGCGNFCTQGRFVQCSSLHHYHRDCQLTSGEKPQCPHCGMESPAREVTISLGRHKHPLFLPEQKLVQRIPSAKMSIAPRGGAPKIMPRPDSPEEKPFVLPSGLEISAEGLFSKPDKEKLNRLLVKVERLSQNQPQRVSISSLFQAAEVGDAERIIQMLVNGVNPSHVFRKKGQRSALHAAACNGHLVAVHILVQSGAQIDHLDLDLTSPLMLAVTEGHEDVVKYLVKAGASASIRAADGMTALHIAAKAGRLLCCNILLTGKKSSEPIVNMTDEGGWTPLVWSCEFGHSDVAKFLLDSGADPLIRDREQNITLHWSAYSGCEQITEVLLDRNCDINTQNVHGDTPLHIAARQGNLACVMLLLLRGADCRIQNILGRTPDECCITKSPCHNTISLTTQLRSITDQSKERTPKILTNDITRGKEDNEVQCINNLDDEGEPLDYKYITENCFTSNISVDRSIVSMQSCQCDDSCVGSNCRCSQLSLGSWYNPMGRLLPEFNFADPPMLFECSQLCSCHFKTCKNRVVQRGIKARFQLFRTNGKGWGVRTLQQITRGSYVCEYIGEIISDCEADHREDDSYLFDLDNRDGETYCIDARHYGNIARFINHMCVPNLQSVRVFMGHHDLHFPRIAFFANRDIQPYEELGFDYGEKFWIIKCKSFFCTCGAPTCRYSKTTIQTTLAEYNRKIQEETYF